MDEWREYPGWQIRYERPANVWHECAQIHDLPHIGTKGGLGGWDSGIGMGDDDHVITGFRGSRLDGPRVIGQRAECLEIRTTAWQRDGCKGNAKPIQAP